MSYCIRPGSQINSLSHLSLNLGTYWRNSFLAKMLQNQQTAHHVTVVNWHQIPSIIASNKKTHISQNTNNLKVFLKTDAIVQSPVPHEVAENRWMVGWHTVYHVNKILQNDFTHILSSPQLYMSLQYSCALFILFIID